MSSASRYADGVNGASVPQGPPSVYLPQTAPPPAYDAYADPAAAHGWQNAYDETRELPPVAAGEPAPPGQAGGEPAPPGEAPRGRLAGRQADLGEQVHHRTELGHLHVRHL
ncbi:hypothetical protein ABZ486_31750, partial [Streptomyces albogriseolus]